jgi:putative membrane protein
MTFFFMEKKSSSYQPDPQLYKTLRVLAVILSVVVPLVVAVLLNPRLPFRLQLPFCPYYLPPFYASINACTAIVLLIGLREIKKGQVEKHRRMMTLAMLLSTVFLICYVIYHLSVEHTAYGGEGLIRSVYYFLLFSHIILAIAVLPMALFTYLRGWARMDASHRKLAKITFPLWLYVAVTGVVVYLMLVPYYNYAFCD